MLHTERNSKVGNFARRLRKIFSWSERPLCVHKARVKEEILLQSRHSQKPTFESRSVYQYLKISLVFVAGSLLAAETVAPVGKPRTNLEYIVKDYSHLYGMAGFNDALLKMHFQLYQGYVKNTNLLLSRMRELEQNDKDLSYDYGALKRRLAWEFNGMRLHELYFENLGGQEPVDKSSDLYQKLFKDFGSFEAWKKNFMAVGMIRGIGWVILYRDPLTGRLMNIWINEHDLGHLAGGEPLLVMDVFEHAYITQYGLDRGKYINAFFDNVKWEKVQQRFSEIKQKIKD